MDKICLGRVIWLDVTDTQGRPAGDHAAIILTTKSEYEAGQPIKAVVISSKLHHARKNRMVKGLPWSPGGHPQTGLSKECAVMCDWIVSVNEDHIRKFQSCIYGTLLKQIVECVEANPLS